MFTTTGANYGVYMVSTTAPGGVINFYHNSVNTMGSSTLNGLYYSNVSTLNTFIKNNIFYAAGIKTYPAYFLPIWLKPIW
ncbi:MAG: hypothetical protein H7296_06335 [Bacteroidia bacterium]|nr:hypothetical protein [Bacteroidia bacterium]